MLDRFGPACGAALEARAVDIRAMHAQQQVREEAESDNVKIKAVMKQLKKRSMWGNRTRARGEDAKESREGEAEAKA